MVIDKLFGTDGIRAVAGAEPLTAETIEKIAECAGLTLKSKHQDSKKVLIGQDTRESCGWILKSLVRGLAKAGLEVYSTGVIPTSAISAILRKDKFLAGVVISASHNPSEFNGIKFFSSDGKKIPDDWEREIEAMAGGSHASAAQSNKVEIRPFPQGAEEYFEFLRRSLPAGKPLQGLKWILDCANGSASDFAPKIFQELGADVYSMHHAPDGKNINLNCGALHPQTLQQQVLKLAADGGCAFDGDADRVQFVDEKGHVMDGDVLIAMSAKHLKEQGELKNDTVVATVMANLGFHKEMEKAGIRVMTVPVGDRAVSDAILSTGAVLGGEQSGHIIFGNYLPTGDGILTALQILKIIIHSKRKLSSYTEMLPKYPQLLLNLKVKKKIPIEKCSVLGPAILDAEVQLRNQGRVLVRYSGTEPLLRIMIEADTLPKVEQMAEFLSQAARKDLEVL